jgi:hypothetical protein
MDSLDSASSCLYPSLMPRSTGPKGRDNSRIQAYLSEEQIADVNRLRGKYLTESGKDVRVTQVLRAAIDQFLKLNWSEIRRLLDAETGGRGR